VRFLDAARMWFGFGGAMEGMSDLLHLFESVYDRGVEFVLVGEVPFKIAASRECLWTERAAVSSGRGSQ
jgi:hypothetical protein